MDSQQDIYALIIGINAYPKPDELRGAVNDANQFEEYLTEVRRVPSVNIKKLIDGEATRAAIVRELEALATDEKIKKNESAIIIFFAGHGASSPAPDDWPKWATVGGQVEQLCPVDVGDSQGIPDYWIRVLLDEIAQAKGNNITVFLDCCHAAGMNRDAGNDAQPPGWIQRSIDTLSLGPFETRWSLLHSDSKAGELPEGDRLSGTLAARESHIQVAACGSGQKAGECFGQGVFTEALVKVLREHPSGILSYRSLMHLLVLRTQSGKRQTPLCDGNSIRRRLFGSRKPEADAALIICYFDRGQFTLTAGSLLGVTVDSEYEVFETEFLTTSSRPLKTVTVTAVQPHTSILRFESPSSDASRVTSNRPTDMPLISFARLSKSASPALRLSCSDGEYLQGLLRSETESPIELLPANADNEADLVLTLKDRNVLFERGPKTTIVSIDGFPAELSQPVNKSQPVGKDQTSRVRGVIDSYAHLLRFVSLRWPSSGDADIHVGLSFRHVAGSHDSAHPVGDELLRADNGVSVEPDSPYGLTVTTSVPFFIYVFCLNVRTSEIDLLHSPQLCNKDANNSGDAVRNVTIGYGVGADPLIFNLDCEPVDVNLFKIFVSDRPVNGLLGLEQPSPFEEMRGLNKVTWNDLDEAGGVSITKTITVDIRSAIQK